jgi:hypothetical protein
MHGIVFTGEILASHRQNMRQESEPISNVDILLAVRNEKCIPVKCNAIRRYVHTHTHTLKYFQIAFLLFFAIVYVLATNTLRVQILNFGYFVLTILLEKLDTENGSSEQDAKYNLVKWVINEYSV